MNIKTISQNIPIIRNTYTQNNIKSQQTISTEDIKNKVPNSFQKIAGCDQVNFKSTKILTLKDIEKINRKTAWIDLNHKETEVFHNALEKTIIAYDCKDLKHLLKYSKKDFIQAMVLLKNFLNYAKEINKDIDLAKISTAMTAIL